MRTPTPATQNDGVHEFYLNHTHAFKCGSTLDHSDQWNYWKTPNPNLFLLASSNLEDEIHFKCGRFVTSQNSKFWNVILNRYLWLFVWLLCDWLCEIEWNLKLFKSWIRRNEMTFPNFHLAFWTSWIQIHFITKTLEWRWYDFFHLNKWKRVLKRFEFHLEIFQIQKL